MKTAAARAELPPTCSIHNKEFIRFGNSRRGSMGCPVCVFIIKEQTRAERDSFLAFYRKRAKVCGPEATGKRKAR